MPRNHPDWIRAYMSYASYSEAPSRFHYWTAVSTMAGALRRRVWIDQKYFQWTPNMYIIFVAPPGIISKSTTAGIGMKLLKQIDGIHFGPNSVTWQKLVESLEDSTEEVLDPVTGETHVMSCLSIASSEFGTFLDPQDRAMVDAMVDLWDGQIGTWEKATKTQGSSSIEQPWVNVIACTTPAWIAGNFPEYMIGGGFASRCIFLYGDVKDKLIAYPSKHIPQDLHLLEKTLVEDLESISSLFGEYHLTEEATALGETWYLQHYADTQTSSDSRAIGYRARKQTHIHKLAMVISAARRDDLLVDATDLQEAIDVVTGLESEMPKVFELIGRTEGARYTEAVKDFVMRAGSVDRPTLMRALTSIFSLKEIQDGVEACVAARYIIPVQDGLRHMYTWNPKLTEETIIDDGSRRCTYPLHS